MRSLTFYILSALIVATGIILIILTRGGGGALFYLSELLLALSLVLLWLFHHRIVKPLNTIANGIDLLREQDFSSRLAPVNQREADRIVDMFNGMMSTLKQERLRVREQNHFLDLLIAASPMGIIILDRRGKINMANLAAARFLDASSPASLVGISLDSLSSSSPLAEGIASMSPDSTATLRLSDSMIYRCSRLAFMDKGYAHPFVMIERLTEELIKAEKLAYEKVIRMMAHEVNNSVAGITSLLDTIAMTDDNPDIAEAAALCSNRCNSMSGFVTAFADVVKIPDPSMREENLDNFITGSLPLLESLCAGRDITLRFVPAETPVTAMLDRVLMEQVLINLVKNAAESIGREGEITISVSADPPGITVADNGPGISGDNRSKIFSPFFSTKADGRGLGLLFAGEVLTRHRCLFSLRTDPDLITRFSISFQQ